MATNEPTQNTEMNKDTNYNSPTGESRQLPAGQAEYTEEYYYQQLDGSYLLVKTETKVGTIGETVTMDTSLATEFWKSTAVGNPDSFFRYHSVVSLQSTHHGIVVADGSLVLSMRVSRVDVFISFYSYQGEMLEFIRLKYGDNYSVPVPPYREGCQFSHWVGLPVSGSSIRVKANTNQTQGTVTGCETILPALVEQLGFNVSFFQDGWWHDYFNSAYWPIYVAAPTTPIATPNPGRTCQDDGYADGYYWDGSACVLPQVYVVPNTATK